MLFPTAQFLTLAGRGSTDRQPKAQGSDPFLEPAGVVARLVALLLKGERGFVERWYKLSASFAGGPLELLTPPENFMWLLGETFVVNGASAESESRFPRESRDICRDLSCLCCAIRGQLRSPEEKFPASRLELSLLVLTYRSHHLVCASYENGAL